VTEKLDPCTYVLEYDARQEEYYLRQVGDLTVPKKMYGDLTKHIKRILTSFNDRKGATGVLLAGKKGAGKTLVGKALSVACRGIKMPTLLINRVQNPARLNAFVQKIGQPCVVLFDEFEKCMDARDQEQVLTLLDGVFPCRHLFILTCNDMTRVNDNLINRPGRIYYSLDFNTISDATIEDYCQEKLENKSHIGDVKSLAKYLGVFTFDQLQTLVEEMNRFQETARSALEILNIRPDNSSTTEFEVVVECLDEATPGEIDPPYTRINPINTKAPLHIGVDYMPKSPKLDPDDPDDDGSDYKAFYVMAHHLVKVDAATGTFVYELPKYNVRVTLKPKTTAAYDFRDNAFQSKD